jgi:transposase
MERAMKVQDVMLQAMAKKITWWQAAEILGISDRHMRRWRERYVEEGYNGLLDRRRGKPSRRRVPLATVEKVFALYREKYFDLNVQHFHEKLQAEHGHLSRKLCWRDSWRSLETGLKHGIELVKHTSDIASHALPLTLLEGRDGEAEFKF